jgi:hypothetical protein
LHPSYPSFFLFLERHCACLHQDPNLELPELSKPASQGANGDRNQQIQYQRDQLAQQDAALASLSQGVANLHGHAKAIGEEAELQNKILDNLDENVDKAHGTK